MVSPLEIDQGVSSDSNDALVAKRRTKRESGPAEPSTLGIMDNNVFLIPFMIMLYVPQLMYQVVSQLVGDPLQTVREFFEVNRETEEMLKDLPGQQQQQSQDIQTVHEEQIHQREKLENLRLRIQKIEERRAARAQQYIPDLQNSQTSSSSSRDKIE